MKSIFLMSSLFFCSIAYGNPSEQCSTKAVAKVKKECLREWSHCELHAVKFKSMTPSRITYSVEMSAAGYDMVGDYDTNTSLKYKTTSAGIICN